LSKNIGWDSNFDKKQGLICKRVWLFWNSFKNKGYTRNHLELKGLDAKLLKFNRKQELFFN
jgi:hypothetical protein